MVGKKLVSDSLVNAVKGITSAEQKDAKGNALSTGDPIRVSEGDYAGKTGTVTGFNTTGNAQVQLNRGRNITISNSSVISEAKLDPVDKSELMESLQLEENCPCGDEEVDEGIIGRATRAIGNMKDKRTISKDDAARKEKRKSRFKSRLKDNNAQNRIADAGGETTPAERIKDAKDYAARQSRPSDKAIKARKRVMARRIRQGAEDRRKANEEVDDDSRKSQD